MCQTKLEEGAPCLPVVTQPSLILELHKLIWLVVVSNNWMASFDRQWIVKLMKIFFPFFGADHEFTVIFIISLAIYFFPGFQTSL